MRKLSLKELNRLSVDQFKEQEKTNLVLVLDNIRSGLNVGSAFRTADAFLLDHIYCCGITAQPPHREILKTAIGATESVEWSYHEETIDVVKNLQDKGYHLIGIEQTEDSIPLQDFKVNVAGKYALVFGNEVKGVQQEVMDKVDVGIEVPQFGTKHSLNISVCVGLVVWEFFRKMKLGQPA